MNTAKVQIVVTNMETLTQRKINIERIYDTASELELMHLILEDIYKKLSSNDSLDEIKIISL